MIVLPFLRRVRPRSPTWRVTLRKGPHARLYEIRDGGDGSVQTWVRFDGHPHRAKLTRSRVELAQIRAEYQREVAALLEDGWQIDED